MRAGSFFVRAIVLFGFIVGCEAVAAAQVLPNGSYQQSCTGCTYDPNSGTLQCSCTTGDGWQNASTLDVGGCSGDISNDDGQLSCDEEGAGISFLPTGSYQQTCTSCTYDQTIEELSCTCTDGDGIQIQTTFDGSCSGDISNDDGQLSCD